MTARSTVTQMWAAAERAWGYLDALGRARDLTPVEASDRDAFLSIMRLVNLVAADRVVIDRLRAAADRAEKLGRDPAAAPATTAAGAA